MSLIKLFLAENTSVFEGLFPDQRRKIAGILKFQKYSRPGRV
jgi:hypothetical protein